MTPPRDLVPPPNWLRLGPLEPAEVASRFDRACFLLSRLVARPVFGRYDLTWLGPLAYGTRLGERLRPGTIVRVVYEQPDLL